MPESFQTNPVQSRLGIGIDFNLCLLDSLLHVLIELFGDILDTAADIA